ncbi:hypothetical protein Cgig2_024150 [Carnegiea gigantea]|uniref:Uncharacterized protein n=1 Tax=Carnegiea gigantea TaxID=171969 RepID=A0A9Q1KAZ2_9CARY|nr:hypothetical protein Cgig2_024150 [Carnegiea gigantea]
MLKLGSNSVQHIFFKSRCRWVFGYTTSATINAGSSDFTVDYLVDSLGFSKEEAIVASSKVRPLKSPENPNSVVNLLKTNGFNETQIKKVRFVDKFVLPFKDEVLDLYTDDMRRAGSALETAKWSIDMCIHSKCVFGYKTTQINVGSSDFAVDYLVNSLGFSKEKSIVASTKVSPLKSPENPNSVVHLLKTSGFNETQIQKVIFSVPTILSFDAGKTLKPKFKAFQDLGLYGSDLADVISVHPHILLRGLDRHVLPTLELLKSIYEDNCVLKEVLKKFSSMLGPRVPKTFPSNIALLSRYGLSMDQIKVILFTKSRYIVLDPKWLQNVLIRVEEKLGIPRGSTMFVHGVFTVGGMSKECIELEFEVFRSFGWSESDVLRLARKNPRTLALSESKTERV